MRSALSLLFALLIAGSIAAQGSLTDSLEKAVAAAGDPEAVIQAKAALAQQYYPAGRLKDAERLLGEALSGASKLNSVKGLGAAYNAKGVLFFYKNMFDSAIASFETSLRYRERSGDRAATLKTVSNIGSIYYMRTEYEKALEYYRRALEMESSLNLPEGSMVSLNNIAQVYYGLKLPGKALAYFRKAEKLYANARDASSLAFAYDGLANVYKDEKKLDSALYFCMRSKQISEQAGDISGTAYAYVNLGMLYSQMKDHDKAMSAYNDALRRSLLLKDKRLQLAIYGNIAALYIEKNDLDAAMVYMEKLVPIQEEIKYKGNEQDLARLFAEYYYRKKDYKRAIDYMKISDRVTDSLYSLETTSRIAEIQEKYQSEKRERQNQLLMIENETVRSTRNYLFIILCIALLGIAGAFFAYRKISVSKRVISAQKELVDQKQKEILDSIQYARRIQYALLASDTLLRSHLPDHFVLFRPKDVVSGDFYWATPSPDGFIYVTGDCTGHGVPGAFMSLLNISKLNEVISDQRIGRPDLILNQVRTEIIRALNPPGTTEVSRDGMDAIVCKLDLKNMTLQFAAANNSFYVCRNGTLIVCKADKMPVGKGHDDDTPFTFNELKLEKGDMIYTFTDGFADQFGGMLGKKFKYRQLEELLVQLADLSTEQQRDELFKAFDNWKGQLEQVDDVCVMGVRV